MENRMKTGWKHKWLIAFCVMGFLCCLCYLYRAGSAKTASAEVPEGDSEERIVFPTGTANEETCRLCGTRSLWAYYHRKDSIGVLNLANGQISDLEIFAYEDDGSVKDNSQNNSTRFNTDEGGRCCLLSTTGNRGICTLDLSWEEDAWVTFEELAPLYCAGCMEKITAMDRGAAEERLGEHRCPFAMIDFTTGELYSLNGIVTSSFIRDYYMHFDFGDCEIRGVVVYAPERFPEEER